MLRSNARGKGSNFLSMIVNDFMDAEDYEDEVRSSEEMRAKFEAYNQETGDKSKTRALSMDVKGLYPAMTRAESKKSVIDMVCNSDVSVENVDYDEAVKLLFMIIKLPFMIQIMPE